MPHVEIPQAEFKVVLLGSSHIGKSSLVTRFSEGYYRENSRQPTVGAAFVTKRIQSSDDVTCKVQIWDTTGQANFRAMAHMFYRDAAAVIVCYDVGSRRSFDEMREWLDELRLKTGAGEVVVAIAALKADLMAQQHHADVGSFVPEQEVQQLADTLGVIYLPTSAKTNCNVTALFQRVTDQVLQIRKDARMQKRNNESQHSHNDVGDSTTNNGGGEGQPQQIQQSNSTNSHVSEDKNGKQSSPRRGKYDKYYVRDGSEPNSTNDANCCTPKRRESKGSNSVGSSKKKKGILTPRSKRKDNSILEEEREMKAVKGDQGICVCQPVACGAGGGSGCIIS